LDFYNPRFTDPRETTMNIASFSLTKLKLGNAWVVFLVIAAGATAANAQTFTTLANFDVSTTGRGPRPVIQGIDGNLHGITSDGNIAFQVAP
jgi:hypothetical protein